MADSSLVTQLYEQAKKNLAHCYAPYSAFSVSCCIASGEHVFAGVNVENAAYPLTACAEANAIGAMVTGGQGQVDVVLVLSSHDGFCPPCGACLQRLLEFSTPETEVCVMNQAGEQRTYLLVDLLPVRFDSNFLTDTSK